MTNVLWITTQFPSGPNDTKGSFIYRTVNELSKEYNLTVICLHSMVPPFLPMLKDIFNASKIYKVWRNKYPQKPIAPPDMKAEVIYAKYIRLPRGKFHYLEGWFGYLGVKKYLKNLVTKDTFIHATWLFPEGDLANIIYKKYQIPFIVTLMGSDVHYLKQRTKKWEKAKNIIQNSKYVTSVSKALYKDLERKKILIPEAKKGLTHTVYEFDKFIIKDKIKIKDKLGIDKTKKIIFYAGTLRIIKNVNILIEAFHTLEKHESNLFLIIAGQGEEEGKLKQLAFDKDLLNNIEFVGGLNGMEMIDYFNAADIFCLPSQNEGLPNVIIESLLCGIPVVASSVGEIPYIIEEGKNGYLAKPGSVKELATKLDSALKSEWDRNELRKSISYLSPKNVIKEYKSIYKNILN